MVDLKVGRYLNADAQGDQLTSMEVTFGSKFDGKLISNISHSWLFRREGELFPNEHCCSVGVNMPN